MVKRKILIITAILAVMVTMTGIVAASQTQEISVTNDGAVVSIGDTVHQIVGFTQTPPTANAIQKFEILDTDMPSGSFDITIDDASVLSVSNTPGWTPPYSWDVGIKNNNIANGIYTIDYKVTYFNGLSRIHSVTISADVSSIPEFPTVALPVAAVIGLVFFFQQRKNKEK